MFYVDLSVSTFIHLFNSYSLFLGACIALLKGASPRMIWEGYEEWLDRDSNTGCVRAGPDQSGFKINHKTPPKQTKKI